jgi:cytoskeletal protein RodZ
MPSRLKEAREKAGYTIEEVALELNIRKQYIICLEEGNFDGIPGKVYVEGYTNMYCDFLGIEPMVKSSNPVKKKIKIGIKNNAKIKKKYIVFCSALLLVLVVVGYSIVKKSEDKARENELIQNILEQHGNNEEEFD